MMSTMFDTTNLETPIEQNSLMTFRLGEQAYALPIEPIVQIIPMVTITPATQLNDSLAGVINVRGALVPVIDLNNHLNLPETSLQLHTPIVLVRCNGFTVGLIVDDVLDVLSLPDGAITNADDILPKDLAGAPVLHGLAKTSNGSVFVLNVDHLFQPEQVEALSQIIEILRKGDISGADSDEQEVDEG